MGKIFIRRPSLTKGCAGRSTSFGLQITSCLPLPITRFSHVGWQQPSGKQLCRSGLVLSSSDRRIGSNLLKHQRFQAGNPLKSLTPSIRSAMHQLELQLINNSAKPATRHKQQHVVKIAIRKMLAAAKRQQVLEQTNFAAYRRAVLRAHASFARVNRSNFSAASRAQGSTLIRPHLPTHHATTPLDHLDVLRNEF